MNSYLPLFKVMFYMSKIIKYLMKINSIFPLDSKNYFPEV